MSFLKRNHTVLYFFFFQNLFHRHTVSLCCYWFCILALQIIPINCWFVCLTFITLIPLPNESLYLQSKTQNMRADVSLQDTGQSSKCILYSLLMLQSVIIVYYYSILANLQIVTTCSPLASCFLHIHFPLFVKELIHI